MTLHSHTDIIDLSPLVEERHPIKAPANASAEEFHCQWYKITEKINYPMGLYSGKVSFNVCFHNLSNGVQSHVFAPVGLDIRQKYTVGGSLPGEPIEAIELGLGAPKSGLYLREDVDMKCNVLMTSFVKKSLKRASTILVDRLVEKAHITETHVRNEILLQQNTGSTTGNSGNTSPYLGAPPSPRFPTSQSFQQQQQQPPQSPYMVPSPVYQPNSNYPQTDTSTFDEKRREQYKRISVVMPSAPMSPPLTPRHPSWNANPHPNSNTNFQAPFRPTNAQFAQPYSNAPFGPTNSQFAPNTNSQFIPNPHYNPNAAYEVSAGQQYSGYNQQIAGQHSYHPTELPSFNSVTDPQKDPNMYGYHAELE